MRYTVVLLLVVGLLGWALPAEAEGGVSVGVVPWSHDTDLDVSNATDFDGSDRTIDQAAKNWDMNGSGMAVRLAYDFPKLISLYGEFGTAQATVRDEDVTDPSLDIESRGLNDGTYLGVGAEVTGNFGSGAKAYWSAGASYSSYSSDLAQDVDTTWDYDETSFALEAKLGRRLNGVGFYGGVRLVDYSADLDETDLGELPGPTLRTTELQRDGDLDAVLGFETKREHVVGFVELALLGTFGAKAGLLFRF